MLWAVFKDKGLGAGAEEVAMALAGCLRHLTAVVAMRGRVVFADDAGYRWLRACAKRIPLAPHGLITGLATTRLAAGGSR